jgi:hypothetical protein
MITRYDNRVAAPINTADDTDVTAAAASGHDRDGSDSRTGHALPVMRE